MAKPNLKKLFHFLARILLAFFIFCAVTVFAVRYSSAKFSYKNTADIPESKIALILGAAVKGGKPSAYLKDRLDKGIELYESGKAGMLMISGDDGNDRDDEITVMRNYLTIAGIPENKIISDTSGYSTYASIYRIKNVFMFNDITVVTQKYHLARSVFLCRKLGISCYGIEADKSEYKNYARNNIRELFATVNACFNIILKVKPKEYKNN